MINSNFKKVLTSIIFSSKSRDDAYPACPNVNLPAIKSRTNMLRQITISEDYARIVMSFYTNLLNNMSKTGSNNTLYMMVGTGTREATENDFDLETINTLLTCDSIVIGSSGNYTKIYTAVFSNTTSNDITITEVGLYGNMVYEHFGTPLYDRFLLDRTVLSTPITIPAGESKAITYELGF